MMTESAFSIEELEELYCLFKVKERLKGPRSREGQVSPA